MQADLDKNLSECHTRNGRIAQWHSGIDLVSTLASSGESRGKRKIIQRHEWLHCLQHISVQIMSET